MNCCGQFLNKIPSTCFCWKLYHLGLSFKGLISKKFQKISKFVEIPKDLHMRENPTICIIKFRDNCTSAIFQYIKISRIRGYRENLRHVLNCFQYITIYPLRGKWARSSWFGALKGNTEEFYTY